MAQTLSAELNEAMRARGLVRLSIRFARNWLDGYVLDVGPRFFLVLEVDSAGFDGFTCCRIADLKRMRPHPHAKFEETALRMRGLRRPRQPRIDLTSTASLLQSAARAFPLVTIHQGALDRDALFIGHLKSVTRARIKLLEIGPDAEWEADASSFRLADITRVNVGGGYQESLWRIGGPPPRSRSETHTPRNAATDSNSKRGKSGSRKAAPKTKAGARKSARTVRRKG